MLGSLITHIGSGISSEIGAALDTLWMITKRKPQELLPMSAFLNGEHNSMLDVSVSKGLKIKFLLESLRILIDLRMTFINKLILMACTTQVYLTIWKVFKTHIFTRLRNFLICL